MTRRDFIKKTIISTSAGFGSALGQSAEQNGLDFKIGQMLMTNFTGSTISAEMRHLILNEHLGGVLLFENNFSTAVSPKASLQKLTGDLQNISSTPMLIAIDQEGGAVNRLKERYGFPKSYSAQYVGQRDDLRFTRETADTLVSALVEMGVNHNFAPVVDVWVNPSNPVGLSKRCFSSDPEIVTRHAEEFIRAHRQRHIVTTLKHFPGHGCSFADSHDGLTDVTKSWQELELVPYQRLI